MQLDQVTANIRLRNPWEAIDLGFTLVRHFWQAIYLPWFIFVSISSLLIYFLAPVDYKEYALFAVWWLKPLYDRFLLNILSHQLFNEQLSTSQALRATPKLIKTTGLFGGLTFRRPSFSRGFNLPIWQLEQLRGKPRTERQGTLLKSAHSHAIGLTLAMIFIELAFYFSIYAIIALFIPDIFQKNIIGHLFSGDTSGHLEQWLHILDHVIYTLAIFLVEPFYIAASFTLYLNRRTQLEAWDIELVFRQIAKRLQAIGNKVSDGKAVSIIALPLLVFLLTSFPVQPSYANNEIASDSKKAGIEYFSEQRLPVEQSEKVIQEIMQRKELSNEETSKHWVKIHKEKDKKKRDTKFWNLGKYLDPFVKIIAILFESSLWIALALGLFMLYLSRQSWLHLFTSSRQNTKNYEAPEVLFGMDVRPQSLPENIPEAARTLWQAHKHRESLSLLYRGALTQLITIDQLTLKSSQTEGDILKLAQQKIIASRHQYLQQLTTYWKQIAYAHQLPQDQEVSVLFDRWEADFVISDSTPTSNNNGMTHKTAGDVHE